MSAVENTNREPRRLVMCFDGTADFAARYPTHVYRLFRSLARSEHQLIYYAGGVGTLKNSAILSPIKKAIYQGLDLAAGFSIRETFVQAFQFLMENWQEGDEIYFFGFSRGSYAARAVAAGVHYFGIPEPEQENMIPYLWEWFSDPSNEAPKPDEDGDPDNEIEDVDNMFQRFNRLKGAFGDNKARRNARIKFMGIWDTVSSFGIVRLRTLPGTSKLHKVDILRHAISIDEKRNMFPENRCSSKHKNLLEVWFAGVHRDVGGGGAREKRGLSMIPYDWIVDQAVAEGLQLDPKKIDKTRPQADPLGPANASLGIVILYALAGLVPMKMWNDKEGEEGAYRWKWLNLWHTRSIPKGALVHPSVKTRMESPNLRYRPRNLNAQNVTFSAVRPELSGGGATRPSLDQPQR